VDAADELKVLEVFYQSFEIHERCAQVLMYWFPVHC
jgi:hypothetical protein